MLAIVLVALLGLVAVWVYFNTEEKKKKRKPVEEPEAEEEEKEEEKKRKRKHHKGGAKKGFTHKSGRHSSKNSKEPAEVAGPKHPLLLKSLQGHNDVVTGMAWSKDGRFVASCSEDETIRVWDVTVAGDNYPSGREKLKWKHGTAIAMSEDGTALIMAQEQGKSLQCYSVSIDKQGVPQLTFSKEIATKHKESIVGLVIGPGNSFVITYGRKETILQVFALPSGDEIATLNTNQMENYGVHISPKGRFLSVSTRMSAAKIWEINYDKASGACNGFKRQSSLALTHKTGLGSLGFLSETEAVSVEKGGQVTIWNLDVQYEMGADVKRLDSFSLPNVVGKVERMVCCPENRTAAIVSGNSIHLLSLTTKQTLAVIDHAHKEWVGDLFFSPDGKRLATVGGDKSIKFWKVPSN